MAKKTQTHETETEPNAEPNAKPEVDPNAPTREELEQLKRLSVGDVMFGGYSRERLFVKLSDLELLERGQQLASVEKVFDDVEDELKTVSASMRAALKSHRAKIQALSKVVNERKEERMVKIVDRADYRTNEMQTIRIDTGDIVRSRTLTREEMQGTLFGEA